MSPNYGTSSLTPPNAAYATRALNHASWPPAATTFVMVLHLLPTADGPPASVWGA